MAPVAPHRFEVENDEALFGSGAREQLVVPVAPLQLVGGSRRGRKRGKGDGGDVQEFHGSPRSVDDPGSYETRVDRGSGARAMSRESEPRYGVDLLSPAALSSSRSSDDAPGPAMASYLNPAK